MEDATAVQKQNKAFMQLNLQKSTWLYNGAIGKNVCGLTKPKLS